MCSVMFPRCRKRSKAAVWRLRLTQAHRSCKILELNLDLHIILKEQCFLYRNFTHSKIVKTKINTSKYCISATTHLLIKQLCSSLSLPK